MDAKRQYRYVQRVFEYVENEYNLHPTLIIESAERPHGKLVADLHYSTSLVFDIPTSGEELRRLHGPKYWSTLRRKERRLQELVGDVRFRILTDEAELRELLPKVQELFAERWAGKRTGLDWKTPSGFTPYAEAMIRLAGQQRAELAVLEGGGKLLSFAYSLLEDDTYYFYQHASTTTEQYRRYSVGKLLVTKLIEDLVHAPRSKTFDFMTGAHDYKGEWAEHTRTIYLRVEENQTPAGFVRFLLRYGYYRARLNPRLRSIAKKILAALPG